MLKYYSENKTMCEDGASIAEWLDHKSWVRFPVQAYPFLSVCSWKIKASKILVLCRIITYSRLRWCEYSYLTSVREKLFTIRFAWLEIGSIYQVRRTRGIDVKYLRRLNIIQRGKMMCEGCASMVQWLEQWSCKAVLGIGSIPGWSISFLVCLFFENQSK